MSALLHRIGWFATRHRGLVVLTWLAVAIAAIAGASILGQRTSVDISLPNTGSQDATDLLTDRFPAQAQGSSPIVIRSTDGMLTDDKNAKAIADATAALKKNDLVASVVSPTTEAGASQLSKNGEIGYLSVTLDRNLGQVTKAEAVDLDEAATTPIEDAGMQAATGGALGQVVDAETSDTSAGIGILAAIIILLLTFGSAVAMGVPIVTAIFSLATAISFITILGHVFGIPDTGPVLATMIGLGVGIDYALFIVTRHREGLSSGMDPNASVAQAIATSGAAVVFAGFTVIIALCSLAVARIPIVTAMGVTSALAVLIAMIAAVTLLPAVLALLGRRLNGLRLPWRKADEDPDGSPRWASFARDVCNRPWIALIISLADPAAARRAGHRPEARPARHRRAAEGRHRADRLRPARRGIRSPGSTGRSSSRSRCRRTSTRCHDARGRHPEDRRRRAGHARAEEPRRRRRAHHGVPHLWPVGRGHRGPRRTPA